MRTIYIFLLSIIVISCSGVKKADDIAILNISQKEYFSVKEANYTSKELDGLDGKAVQLIGILRLVNAEPMTDWVVTLNTQLDIYIVDETKTNAFNFLPNQGKYVSVYGKLMVKKLVYENPVYNHSMYYILINNER